MKRISLKAFGLSILSLAVLVGCGKKETKSGGDAPGSDAPSGGEIKIGVVQPLSGPLAPYGKNTVNGIKLRVKEINDGGGVNGKKLVLAVQDNKGDGTESVNAMTTLIGSEKVVAVIAPVTSSNTLKIKKSAKKYQIPSISPTATNDKVTENNDYVFRTCFNDSFQGIIVANYAAKSLKLTKAAIMKDMNSDYSKGLSASFEKAFTEAGGQVVATEGYQQGDTDFATQLKKVKESGAETLFVPGYPPELPLIIKQATAMGVEAKLCGADGWDNDTVINGSGEGVEGCFLVGAFAREDQREIVQNFIKAYKAEYGTDAGSFEALGYDTVSLLVEALKTGETSEAIKTGLLGIKDFEAVTGKVTIAPNGDATKSAVVLEITKDGDKFKAAYKQSVEP